MDKNITRRDFSRTHAALAAFRATKEQRENAWNRIETNADAERCMANDDAACMMVQDAFYEDTADINRREDCHRISVSVIARMTGWSAA